MLKTLLATVWALSCLPVARASQPEFAPAVSETTPDSLRQLQGLDGIVGPVFETTVVGMNLQGERRRDRIRVPDLDVIFLDDGRRLLPLLRVLSILEIPVEEELNTVRFQPEGAPAAIVNYLSGEIRAGAFSEIVPVEVGLSDVTHQGEIFVPAGVLGALVGMDIQWDEQYYEYIFYTDQKLRVFEQFYKPTPSVFSMASQEATINLPGNLPPARISRLEAPDINFAEIRFKTRVYSSEDYSSPADRFSVPNLKLWGQVFGGNLAATLSQKRYGSQQGITADHASWTTWMDHTEISGGDSHFGISELVFPSINLLGMRVNGLMGGGHKVRSAGTGRGPSFMPSHVFEGYAPVGSEVTLYVNGREIDAQVAEPHEDAPPAKGFYRFEGLNLLTRSLNDVRIVTVAPDGTMEETRREVMSTNQLVPDGNVSYVGGVGTQRIGSGDRWTAEGVFAGGRVLYGVTPTLSLGFSGAFQKELFDPEHVRYSNYDEDLSWLPERSLHAGSAIAWQPIGRLLVTGEAARSQDPAGGASGWAFKSSADFRLRQVNVRPHIFWYGPTFFEGKTVGLRNRAGEQLGLSWISADGHRFSFQSVHIRDNLDRAADETLHLGITHLSWNSRTVIPKSTVGLGWRQYWDGDRGPMRSYSVELGTSLVPSWNIRGNYEFGEDFTLDRRDDLLRRLRFGHFGGIGPNTSRVEVSRRLARTWQLSMVHRSAFNMDRSFLDLTRRQIGSRTWHWRLSLGYDWGGEVPFVDNRFAFFLDSAQRNRILLESRFFRNDWTVNLWVELKGLFGFVNKRPFWVRDTLLNPDSGGVKGKVFLDFNANGLLDSGEPGLDKVDVVSDMGRQTVSGRSGQFIIPHTTSSEQMVVHLDAENLPAIYTPTQAIQEAVIQPGLFAEVNLGVAAFGSITGKIEAPDAQRILRSLHGVRIVLVDAEGEVVNYSITDQLGYYYLGEVKPGRYSVMVEKSTLPPGLDIEVIAREVEVLSGTEPYEVEDLSFFGAYTGPPQPEEGEEEIIREEDVEYRIFD